MRAGSYPANVCPSISSAGTVPLGEIWWKRLGGLGVDVHVALFVEVAPVEEPLAGGGAVRRPGSAVEPDRGRVHRLPRATSGRSRLQGSGRIGPPPPGRVKRVARSWAAVARRRRAGSERGHGGATGNRPAPPSPPSPPRRRRRPSDPGPEAPLPPVPLPPSPLAPRGDIARTSRRRRARGRGAGTAWPHGTRPRNGAHPAARLGCSCFHTPALDRR